MTNNTIANVPRRLLERAVQIPSKASVEENHAAIVDRGRAQAEIRALLSTTSPANHVEDVRAMVTDPSPAGVGGLEIIGWYTDDHLDDKSATTYSWTVAERWVEKGWPVSPLYAAPVSEAKAQGVVMPERKTKADYGVYIDEFADEAAAIYNAALDEVARLNATTVQQVSVPAWMASSRAFADRLYMAGWRDRADAQHSGVAGMYDELLSSSTAAPAADAGLSLAEWAKDANEWGGALNYAAWEFVNECPEKSALLFNNTKGPLRAAIMKYAEIVSANAKDSSHD